MFLKSAIMAYNTNNRLNKHKTNAITTVKIKTSIVNRAIQQISIMIQQIMMMIVHGF